MSSGLDRYGNIGKSNSGVTEAGRGLRHGYEFPLDMDLYSR